MVAIAGDDPGIISTVLTADLSASARFVAVDASETELDELHAAIVKAAGADFELGSI